MSKGKMIRDEFNDALDAAMIEYLNLKDNGEDTKTARGIVRGMATMYAILVDPENNVDNKRAIVAIEKEFQGRVS